MRLFALLAATFTPVAPALAQSQADVVGAWYSETKESKSFAGRPYDIRRELLVNHADQTKNNTFRYYKDGAMVSEVKSTYRWGVEGKTYWTECQTVIANGEAHPCSMRIEYDLIAATSSEIRYKSRASGITYSALRVAADFKLP